ncbi:hypothetical protein ACFRAE_11300 [Sphingobacterium sp. HJSM2_6]|uniref:hypothetical protein n=1 Tax=Sphingobacterium sp. HJSM2_6 TaxID=3366264 RepID=UPI003BE720F2
MKEILLYLRAILGTHKYLWVSVPVLAVLVWFVGFYLFEMTAFRNLIKLNDTTLQNERDKLLYSLASRNKFELSIIFTSFLPLVHLYFIKNFFYKDYHFAIPISIGKKFVAFISFGIIIYIINFIVISLLNYGLAKYLQLNYYDELMQAYEKAGYIYYRIREDSIFYNGKVNLENLKNSYLYLIIIPAYYLMILFFKNYSLLIFIAALSIAIPSLIISIQKIENLIGYGFSYNFYNETLTYYYTFFHYLITACIFNYAFYMLLKDKEI